MKPREDPAFRLSEYLYSSATVSSVTGDLRIVLDELKRLRERVRELETDLDFACENTPTKGCDCPGCCNARSAAREKK